MQQNTVRFHPYATPTPTPSPAVASTAVAVASAATIAPKMVAPPAAAAPAKNAKQLLNEWFQKNGYVFGVSYATTGAVDTATRAQRFTCTLALPIEGAGDLSTVAGVGSSKKDAEMNCAARAMEVISGLGLLNACLKPPGAKKKPKPKAARPSIPSGYGAPIPPYASFYTPYRPANVPKAPLPAAPSAVLSTVPAIPSMPTPIPAATATTATAVPTLPAGSSRPSMLPPPPLVKPEEVSSPSAEQQDAYEMAPPAAADGPPAVDTSFEQLKAQMYHYVSTNPGKRASVYTMMCPQGEQRKRVQAALYALEAEGLLAKTPPTQGVKLAPFWHPVGYTGPMGGSLDPEQLGEGRNFPLTELKMVLFDLLVEHPHKNCIELMALCAQAGYPQERKVIQAALYQMEREGHAMKTLNTTPGPGPKWPTWETITENAPPPPAPN